MEVCNATFARNETALVAFTPSAFAYAANLWFFHPLLAYLVLCVLVTFVAGYRIGCARGYARGRKDGNPFPRLRVGSPLYVWLIGICE